MVPPGAFVKKRKGWWLFSETNCILSGSMQNIDLFRLIFTSDLSRRPTFCVASFWRNVFESRRCFGSRSFLHAVMVTGREGSWQDGSKRGRHAVCPADAALCSREVPRWWRLSGVSRGAITFQSKNKQIGLLADRPTVVKPFICKGLCSWRLVFLFSAEPFWEKKIFF